MYIDISSIHWIPVGKIFYLYPTRCISGIRPDRTHVSISIPIGPTAILGLRQSGILLIAKSLRLVGHLDLDEKNSTRTWEDRTGWSRQPAGGGGPRARAPRPNACAISQTPPTDSRDVAAECVGGAGQRFRCRSIAAVSHAIPDGNRLTVCQIATRPRLSLGKSDEKACWAPQGKRPRNRAPPASPSSPYILTYRPCPAGRTSCRLGVRARFPFLFSLARGQPRKRRRSRRGKGRRDDRSRADDVLRRRRGVPAARVAPGPALRAARRPRLFRRRRHLDHRVRGFLLVRSCSPLFSSSPFSR
jgi:hypothetical protein